jgi:VCBS repeat-containing protein
MILPSSSIVTVLKSLQDGEIADLVINYTVVDTDGAVTAKETLLNVVGTNDAPTITVVKADTNGLSEHRQCQPLYS